MNYTIWAALGPGALPIWLCIVGFLLMLFRKPKVGLRLTGAGAVLLFVLAILPTADWLMRPLEARFPAPRLDNISPASIVVLAGGEDLPASARRGEPEYTEASERILTGIALARRFPGAKLYLVGGVSFPGDVTDVLVMKSTAVAMGINPKRIRVISGTRNTFENARAMAPHLRRDRRQSALLITSAHHMPRAALCFEAVNSSVVPVPVDYRTSGPDENRSFRLSPLSNLRTADLALHEWIGLAYYRITGRTLRVWPSR